MTLHKKSYADCLANDNLKTDFEREGYLVVEDLLDDREIRELSQTCQNYLETQPQRSYADSLKAGYLSQWGVFSDHYFFAENAGPQETLVRRNTKAARIAGKILGEYIREGQAVSMQVMYGDCGCKQPWHQDHWPQEGQKPWINCMTYPEGLSEDNGCFMVIPGSHKRPLMEKMPDYDLVDGALKLTCKPGSVVFFYMCILHAASENRTSATRYGIKTHYAHAGYEVFGHEHEQHFSRGIRRGEGAVAMTASESGSYYFEPKSRISD